MTNTKLVGKSRISVTAVYNNGVALMNEQEFVSDCFERKTSLDSSSTIIAFSVPTQLASSIREAMRRGDCELLIEGVANPTERAGA